MKRPAARPRPRLEALEERVLLALDFGDAPDLAAGAARGDYNTLLGDNGPRHTIVAGLRLGASVAGDVDSAPGPRATGDRDEDGLVNPAADLILTAGAAPTVAVRVTNTTGRPATLTGWIDADADGLFSPAERAQAAVPSGTTGGVVTLTFPALPPGATGPTFARFRLGTTAEAAAPTGPAPDGEVEDYQAFLTRPSSGLPDAPRTVKVADATGGGPALVNDDQFGRAVSSLGDLDGDGVNDLAVGTRENGSGAVFLLRMNATGTVKGRTKIASATGGGPLLAGGDYFGSSATALGDLDGDGVTDLAVGAPGDSREGSGRGAVYVLRLNADGTVKASTRIASGVGGGPALADGNAFGCAVAALGDLDGDGVTDLAVGARFDDTGGAARGAVHILRLNADGTVRARSKIASSTGGGPALADADFFGCSVASLGDLDGDGLTDLAVGASRDGTGGRGRGAVYILRLSADGSVNGSTKMASGTGGGPALANDDYFGRSVASLGDLDGDGITDLAVGAYRDLRSTRGVVHVLRLNADGSAKASSKIASGTSGGPALADYDAFGSSVASLGDIDGDGLTDLAVGALGDDGGGRDRGAVYVLHLLAAMDFGDAPDAGGGTGRGDYQTRLSDGGPSHTIVAGLRLGASVAGDVDGAPGPRATGDRDEDGLVNPAADLILTAGAAPTVAVRVTNTTGRPATLTGWIDADADGLFSPAERAQAAVPSGTTGGVVTLTFPALPPGATGPTFARFRLGTTAEAANPTGPAPDGEVEDYQAFLTRPSSGLPDAPRTVRVADATSGGPALADFASFGTATASLGDLDGDGVPDLAVGASGDGTGGFRRGAVYIVLLNAGGTVKSSSRIASGTGGGPTLVDSDEFGTSVAALGDIDGDGVVDLAVGARGDDAGGSGRGAVYVLRLNANGTVKSSSKIASGIGGGPVLANYDSFGSAVTSLGDLDGDGITDLAVGADRDDTGGSTRGAVYVLRLSADGSVKAGTKIASGTAGGPALPDMAYLGSSVAALGDIDGDGITDLAVGAKRDATGGPDRGAVYLLRLLADGSVKASNKIASGTGGGPALANSDTFGSSLTALGDLDGDGVTDLAVGAYGDATGGAFRGAVYILRLKADGTVKGSPVKIASGTGGGPALADEDAFGSSVTLLGDLDGDGVADLAAGARGNDGGGTNRGAVYVLHLTGRSPTAVVVGDGASQNGTVGTPVGTRPSVRVSDGQGPLPGVPVTFTVTAGGGGVTGASAFTNSLGVATLGSWTLGAVPGGNSVTATVTGFPVLTFAADASRPVIGASAGQGQVAPVGTAVPTRPSVRVTDALGVPRAGVTVTFATASGGSVSGASAVSGADGLAAVGSWTLGPGVGTNILTATAAGYNGSPVVFTATATAGAPASLGMTSAPDQPGTVGEAVASRPAVVVRDAFGNPVPGVGVIFAVSGGGGSLPGGDIVTVTTDAAGVAALDWTLGTAPGANVLTAAVAGLPVVTFTATAQPGASAQLVFATQPRTVVPGQLITPALVVLIQDRFGNVVTTDSSIVSIDLGNNPGAAILGGNRAVNAVNGRAEFNVLFLTALGSGYNLIASNGALQRSFSAPFDVRAASLVSSATTALAGEPVTFTFRAFSLVPYQGTPFGTATFSAGGRVLGTAAVNADGIATLTTADLPAAPGGLTVTAVYNDGLGSDVILTGPRAADTGVMAETTVTVVARTDLGVPVTIVFGVGSSGVLATLADGAGAGAVAATVRTNVAQVGQYVPARYRLDPQVGDNPLFSLAPGDAPDTVLLVANFTARFAARRSYTVTLLSDAGLGTAAQTFTVFVASADPASPARTVVTLSSSAGSARAGEALRFTAKVTGAGRTPVGSVLLVADGEPVGALTLVNGQATFTVTNLGLGRRFLSAVYTGDGEANASTSAPPLEVRVGDADPSAAGKPKDALGVWDPGTATWYVLIQGAAKSFVYGLTTWTPIVGDWDGDGVTTIGTIDPVTLTWYLRNSNTAGSPDAGSFQFGVRGWIPVVGDWNGDGKDDLGVFDPTTATWYLFNQGVANKVQFGLPGWTPIVGDWTKLGRDSIGVFDPVNAVFYQLTNLGLNAFQFGAPGWKPVAGDWDGDGLTSVGVIEPMSSTWYLRGSNTAGVPDAGAFQYGVPGWVPLRGAWEGRAGARAAGADSLRDLAALLVAMEERADG